MSEMKLSPPFYLMKIKASAALVIFPTVISFPLYVETIYIGFAFHED
jgi:hypothetical protein